MKEAFSKAKNEREREAIDKEMNQLIEANPDRFEQAMVASAKDSADKATQLAVKQKLSNILPAISLVYIAKTYFNKTDSWLYQKMNNNKVNGKTAVFTKQEIDKMKFALKDLSIKLDSVSSTL